MLLSSLLALAFPLVVSTLLDAAFVKRDSVLLNQIALGLLALFATTAVLNYVQTYWLSATGERAVAGLRRELFGKLLDQPPGFFADRRTGELTSRLTADIALLQGILSHQLAEGARQVLALTGGVTILTLMQPRLMLASTTGRAVFYSFATTMVSFGTLAFSNHRGVASLGLLLAIGMSITMLCNLIVLPALIEWRLRPTIRPGGAEGR
jgi:ABC-type multidrug transport system fused ATPase/permease subunit